MLQARVFLRRAEGTGDASCYRGEDECRNCAPHGRHAHAGPKARKMKPATGNDKSEKAATVDRAGTLKVFVHGWATDSSVWDGAVEELSSGDDFLLVGLPGHGGRGRWLTPTLEPAVAEIGSSLDGSDGRRVVGIGWSLGAEALIQAAATRPGAFSALVLVGATARFVKTEGYPHGQSRALVRRMIQDMRTDPASALERFYPLNFTDAERETAGAREFMERFRYPGPVVCTDGEYGVPPGCYPEFNYTELAASLEALYSADLRGLLERIDCPVLAVHGSEDAVCPVGAGEHLARNIRGAELVTIEGAGHAPFLTRLEEFTGAVEGFLKRALKAPSE